MRREPPISAPSARLVVDAMNVIGSRPDGWWRDRASAARAFIERLQRFAAATGTEVTVVLDGRPLAEVAEGDHGNIQVLYGTRAARNAADDRIVARIAADPERATLIVVTADRGLIARVESLGATVRSPSTLLRDLDLHAQP